MEEPKVSYKDLKEIAQQHKNRVFYSFAKGPIKSGHRDATVEAIKK